MSAAYETVSVDRGARHTRLSCVPQMAATAWAYRQPSAQRQALADGAALYLPLGEPDVQSPYAYDATPYGRDATNTGLRVQFGRPGAIPVGDPSSPERSAWFDGTATLTTEVPSWQPGIAGFTLACWCKPAVLGTASTLIAVLWAGRRISLGITANDTLLGQIDATSTNLNSYESVSTVHVSTWHHVAFVVPNDGTNCRVVLDGVTDYSAVGVLTHPFFPTAAWTIGSEGGSSAFFRGGLQAVWLAPVALTDAQLTEYVAFAIGGRPTRVMPAEPFADPSRAPRVSSAASIIVRTATWPNLAGAPYDIELLIGDGATQRPVGNANGSAALGTLALFTLLSGATTVWQCLAGDESFTRSIRTTPGYLEMDALVRVPTPAAVAAIARVDMSVWARSTGNDAWLQFLVSNPNPPKNRLFVRTATAIGYIPVAGGNTWARYTSSIGVRNPLTRARWLATDIGALSFGLRAHVAPTPIAGDGLPQVATRVTLSALSMTVVFSDARPAWLGGVRCWVVPANEAAPDPARDSPTVTSFDLAFTNPSPPSAAGTYQVYGQLVDVFGRTSRLIGPTTLEQA